MLEVAGENGDELGDIQKWYISAGTMDASTRAVGVLGDTWGREKSGAMSDPDLDTLQTG